MSIRLSCALSCLLLFPLGCHHSNPYEPQPLKYKAAGQSPEVIALYEAWFGHPKHISVGYSTQDPVKIGSQIEKAKSMGISAFVVDWYGDREPFIDRSYAVIQKIAAEKKFHVAMMYDETDADDGATDEAIADFKFFHDTYLSSSAPGRTAYLTYQGRPVIFIFPKGRHTDWERVRQSVAKWSNPPWLIEENLPGTDANAFDGFYAWIQPGPKGWAADGSNWGEPYLHEFYEKMHSKFADKIIVGAAWAGFDDSKASWGLNRHISARCGQTLADTFNLWRKYFPANDLLPYVMVETWNDHEEGTAIEDGLPPRCDNQPVQNPLTTGPVASTASKDQH
jgi:hypothetical protein